MVVSRPSKSFKSLESWLSTFPNSWITKENTEHLSSDLIIIKKCIIVHQKYGLAGRNVFDEEYLFISPTNEILDSSPIYRSRKVVEGTFLGQLLTDGGMINPWKDFDAEIKSNGPLYFHAVKPNYGHMLLDFLPDLLSIHNHLIKNKGELFTGANPDYSVYEALDVVSKWLRNNMVDPNKHLTTKKSYTIFLANNVIISPLRSRCERVSLLKNGFIPLIANFKENESKKKVIINREQNPRLKIDKKDRKSVV